ncbi:hypothetical protein K466DRAFT_592824 [Polyporus arcularius HHB13444]|uniref:Uncharacterized protein n=1 Tax=Polyporus arcularius HHB13444 TaxID=1314778 RepID=A0A5C3NMD7_9APHY|nr:hypothetical protein K466DRAFT_592824 [Polyporus arcularius HHB13444]
MLWQLTVCSAVAANPVSYHTVHADRRSTTLTAAFIPRLNTATALPRVVMQDLWTERYLRSGSDHSSCRQSSPGRGLSVPRESL